MTEGQINRQDFDEYIIPMFAPAPFIPVKGEGSTVWDQTGKSYIDFAGGIAVNGLGHAHPAVKAALIEQADKLWHIGNGYTNEPVLALAKQLVDATFADKVFFCNSGAEANEAALKLARKYAHDAVGADKNEIVAFNNAFHGRTLFTVSAGGQPKYSKDFAPLPGGIRHVAYNDLDAAKAIISDKTCAVIVEPIQGEGGVIPADPQFLQGLRALCDQFNAVLIFDEVMTGFRTARGGCAERFGIKPDMITLGKIVGGGMPLAAYAGKREIMAMVSPLGGVYQAGTLSGNPMAVAAGIAHLKLLDALRPWNALEAAGKSLREGLARAAADADVPVQVNGVGSMFTVFFSEKPVTDTDSALAADTNRFAKFFRSLLADGVYFPPSQFESCFLSTEHSRKILEETIDKVATAFKAARG